jgi:glycosyltransferase involved in cell wall biosynthesis
VNRDQRRALIKQNKKLAKDLQPRVLWVSNAPWASTGYGQQTAQVVPRLKADNINVAIAANYGLEANTTNWTTSVGDVKVYPRGYEQWSNDVIPAHMYDWHSEEPNAETLIITLFDTWVFKGSKWADWNVACWTPVDHSPAPPEVTAWAKQAFVKPIAMSKFGQTSFENVNIKSWYVPHAIEKVFKRTEEIQYQGEIYKCRDLVNSSEDKFVVGMNAANKGIMPNRKAFGENLLAFSLFAKKHDDVVLYLHTDPFGALGGINLSHLIQAVGIPQEKIVFADPYMLRTGLPQELMACVYSGMDVLLATSYGEGFGIPTIEAQACGVPVIASNFAASAELVGDGWLIEGQPLWDAPQKSWFNIPSVPMIIDALEQAYNRGRKVSEKAVEFAKQYEADTVYENYWKPALKGILNSRKD